MANPEAHIPGTAALETQLVSLIVTSPFRADRKPVVHKTHRQRPTAPKLLHRAHLVGPRRPAHAPDGSWRRAGGRPRPANGT